MRQSPVAHGRVMANVLGWALLLTIQTKMNCTAAVQTRSVAASAVKTVSGRVAAQPSRVQVCHLSCR